MVSDEATYAVWVKALYKRGICVAHIHEMLQSRTKILEALEVSIFKNGTMSKQRFQIRVDEPRRHKNSYVGKLSVHEFIVVISPLTSEQFRLAPERNKSQSLNKILSIAQQTKSRNWNYIGPR